MASCKVNYAQGRYSSSILFCSCGIAAKWLRVLVFWWWRGSTAGLLCRLLDLALKLTCKVHFIVPTQAARGIIGRGCGWCGKKSLFDEACRCAQLQLFSMFLHTFWTVFGTSGFSSFEFDTSITHDAADEFEYELGGGDNVKALRDASGMKAWPLMNAAYVYSCFVVTPCRSM